MARADYVYTITSRGGRKVLVIEDQDLGRMSVTNCIEDVVAEICTREKIVAREYVIVYMDSEYKWGGWDDGRQEFVVLRSGNWRSAVDLYVAEMVKKI